MTSITDPLINEVNNLLRLMSNNNAHRHVSQSTSTNSELIEQVQTGTLNANQIHALTADTQSGGRGQNGRSWQSPKGNVYLSLYYPILHPTVPLLQPISGLLSLCVGYCLAQLPIIQQINKTLANPIGVKWANDIGFYEQTAYPQQDGQQGVVQQAASQQETSQQETSQQGATSGDNQAQLVVFQFRKLAGILIEPVMKQGKMLGIVVGVGLNVTTAPNLSSITQEGMSYQSLSLSDLLASVPTGVADQEPLQVPSLNQLYQPIFKAILEAIIAHQRMSTVNHQDDNPQNHRVNQTDSTPSLQDFLTEFAQVDLLKNRTIKVRTDNVQSAKSAKSANNETHSTHSSSSNTANTSNNPANANSSSTNATNEGQNGFVIGRAMGIDKNGCLQLQGNDGKVQALFSGKIDVIG